MSVPKTELSHHAFFCAPRALTKALRNGANPNEADPQTGTTPLMWLCEMHDNQYRERKRMFRALIKAGAKLDALDLSGTGVWHYSFNGTSRSFRSFLRSEWKRIIGKNPSRFVRRSECNVASPLPNPSFKRDWLKPAP